MPANSRSACGGIDPRTPHHGELPAGEMQLADDRGQARIWFTCRLSGCNLAQLRLQGASFHRSELEGCSFADSDLTSAIFAEVQALRCDFERATLTLAQAQKARFSECAMNGAHWGTPG